jgi:hypothetical protein
MTRPAENPETCLLMAPCSVKHLIYRVVLPTSLGIALFSVHFSDCEPIYMMYITIQLAFPAPKHCCSNSRMYLANLPDTQYREFIGKQIHA